MLARLLLALALCVPLAAGAADGALSAADVDEIRAVIHRQIDAFRRDDGPGAFALASPEVQQAFGSAERFMEAVRVAYAAVYRPTTVAFVGLLVMGGDVVQQVQVTDRSGSVWIAYYAMQRQKDGTWRANGCHLAQPARTIPT